VLINPLRTPAERRISNNRLAVVVFPSGPRTARGLLASAIRDPDPVVFLEHKRTYRLVRGEVPEEDYTVPIGKAEVKRPGKNISLITYGLVLHYSLEAADLLEREGVSVEVVDLRTLRPRDRETILSSVKQTGRALVVHEDNLTGGIGAEVAAIIAQEAFDSLDAPVTRLAGPDVPAMPFAPNLEAIFMLNTEKIASALRKLAAY
jgi:2-oxoisovalerate dehydrogenase E1 component beta subunit